VVIDVLPDGLIAEKNRKLREVRELQDQDLRIGDRIVIINGKREDLAGELSDSEYLHMLIVRGDDSNPAFDDLIAANWEGIRDGMRLLRVKACEEVPASSPDGVRVAVFT